jgi:hypothetical protein
MTKKAQDIANEAAKMAAEMAYLYTMNKLGQGMPEDMGTPELHHRGLGGIADAAGCPNIKQVIVADSMGQQSPQDLIAMVQNSGELQRIKEYVFGREEASPGRNQATWNELVGVLQNQGVLVATTASQPSTLTKIANKLEAKIAPKSPLMVAADKLQKHLKK